MPVDPLQVRELSNLRLERCRLSCCFDVSGQNIVTGGMTTDLSCTPLTERKLGTATHAGGSRSWIAALAPHPAGRWIFSGDYGGQLASWEITAEGIKPIWSLAAHHGWIRAVAISPDGQYVATAGNDKIIRLWTAADARYVRDLAGHAEHVYSLAFHPVTGRLVSGDLTGVLKEWDVTSGQLVRDLTFKDFFVQQGQLRLGGVRTMTFDAAGKWLVCGGMTGFGSIGDGIGSPTVILIDWETGEQKQLGYQKEAARTFVMGAAIHPDGFIVAATGGLDRGYLMFWKIGQTEKEAFFQFKLPESAWGMDMHPNGQLIVTGHHDGHLRLYEMPVV